MAVVWKTDEKSDVEFWWIIPLLSGKDLVGKVVSISPGIRIESMIGGLPLNDGTTTDIFFAYRDEVSSELHLAYGDYVRFQWKNPGTRRMRSIGPGDPIPTKIRVVSEVEAQRYAEELNKDLGAELHQRLRAEIAELGRAKLSIEKKIETEVEARVREKEEELRREKIDLFLERQELDRSQDQLKKREAQIQDLERKLKDEEARIDDKFEELERFYEENIKPHSRLFEMRRPKRSSNEEIQWVDPEELGKNWSKMLGAELNIPTDLGMSFLLASLSANVTGSIVLLSGPVGTGKTNTIRVGSRLLGGRSAVIPVRPGWLDSSDLLGFYDPLQDNYSPSPFVNSLCEANESIERAFFLALDELNLARIENYGADLLSVLEYSRQEEASPSEPDMGGLQLYAKGIEQRLLEEKKILQNQPDKNTKEVLRLKDLEKLLGSTFYIPENVVLLGTLNADETTYDLSPKVIDRSYVLTFPYADLQDKWQADEPHEPCPLNLNELRRSVLDSKLTHAAQANWTHIARWNTDYLQYIGLPLGYRAKRDYRVFMAVAQRLGVNANEAFRYFVFMKILPRIKMIKSHAGQTTKTDALASLIEEMEGAGELILCESAKKVIAWLKEQLEDKSRPIVTYWR